MVLTDCFKALLNIDLRMNVIVIIYEHIPTAVQSLKLKIGKSDAVLIRQRLRVLTLITLNYFALVCCAFYASGMLFSTTLNS